MDKISQQIEALRIQASASFSLFKPTLFRLRQQEQVKDFEKVLQVPGLYLVDVLFDQVKELLKALNPSVRFSNSELEDEARKRIGSDPKAYGVWAYYPWSRRLVHILDHEEFVTVRTSRNQYKITPAERDQLATKKIGVVGLSVGQSVSVTLAMERVCGEIRLADFDLLELTNLNRIRTGVHNLGLPKVYSVAREIAEIDPYIHVKCFTQGLTEQNMDEFFGEGGKLDLLVEESDGFDIKILCRHKARELQVPVIMEASDRCMVDVERFDLEPQRPILHGIVKNLDIPTLKSLKTNEEKIPYMLDVLGFEKTSSRLRASMLEMQHTINTWPQLASAVTMGGGITADVSRRILLNHFTDSGRYYVDVEQLIGNKNSETCAAGEFKPYVINDEDLAKIVQGLNVDPQKETYDKELRQIVDAARLAPSFGNAQPWLWIQNGNDLVLINAAKTNDFASDPLDHNLFMSLGAAIENARLKADELGFLARVQICPFGAAHRIAARLSMSRAASSSKNNIGDTITARATTRLKGNGDRLTEPQRSSLLSHREDGVSLQLIEAPETIKKIAFFCGEAEKFMLTDETLHSEYFSRILRASPGAQAGVSKEKMHWPPAVELAMEVVKDPAVSRLLGQWQLGTAFAKYTKELIESSSAIGLLQVDVQDTQGVIKAGMLMQRLWLESTGLGVGFHPVSSPLAMQYLEHTSDPGKKTHLIELNEQLSLIFSGMEATNVVLLFRLTAGVMATGHDLRKTAEEVYIKVN